MVNHWCCTTLFKNHASLIVCITTVLKPLTTDGCRIYFAIMLSTRKTTMIAARNLKG